MRIKNMPFECGNYLRDQCGMNECLNDSSIAVNKQDVGCVVLRSRVNTIWDWMNLNLNCHRNRYDRMLVDGKTSANALRPLCHSHQMVNILNEMEKSCFRCDGDDDDALLKWLRRWE